MSAENPKKILLVEDEILIAMLEKQQLESIGYAVHHVFDGEHAIQSALHQDMNYDIILMDIDLGSGIDGTQAAEEILKDKDIPVVFLSSHIEPAIVNKTEKITSYGYVVKNSGIIVLDASIKMALKLFYANRQTKEKEALLNETQRLTRVGGWQWDIEQRKMFWTDEAYRIHGLEPGSLESGSPDHVERSIQCYDPVNRPLIREAFELCACDGTEYDLELPFTSFRGEKKWIRTTGRAYRQYGKIISVIGNILDISDQKKAEIALIESENKYSTTFHLNPNPMAITDFDTGIIIDANHAFANWTGYSIEECIGVSTKYLNLWVKVEDRNKMIHLLNASGIVNDEEFIFKKKNGEYGITLFSARIFYLAAKPLILSLVKDITALKRTEEELLEREARYRTFFTYGLDGVVILDPKTGKMIEFNDQACHQLGYTRDEFAQLSVASIEALESPDEVLRHIRTVQEKGIDCFETRQRNKHGAIRDVHVTAQVIETGKLSFYHCIWRDITEQKHATERLQESEEKYRTLIESANESVFFFDLEGKFIDVNNYACEKLGYTKEELIEVGPAGIDTPEYAKYVPEQIEKILKDGQSVHESVHKSKDGGEIPVEINARLITYKGKKAIIAFAHDITERKRAEAELRQTEQRLRLANRATNDVIWDWDAVNDTQRWNESGTVVFGWTEIVEHPVNADWWVQRVHPDDRQRVHDTFFGVVNNPLADVWRDEYRFLKTDGAYADVMDRGYVLRNEQGKALRMVGAMLNITERKRAEEEIQAQLKNKEILLKEVHHRIKNNIASIASLLKLHTGSTSNAEARRILTDVVGSVESMRNLYEKLLGSIDHNNVPLKEYIDDLGSSILNLFEVKDRITLQTNIDPILLTARQTFPLGLILNELITNTIKYAFKPGGVGTISISAKRQNQSVELIVQDNGKGLSADFDIDESTGFGLFLVKMLIQQLKGGFKIENSNGARCVIQFEA